MESSHQTVDCPLCDGRALLLYHATTDDPKRLYRTENFRCTALNASDHGPVYRCSVCGVGFIWPQPDPTLLRKLYENAEDPLYNEEEDGRRRTWDRMLRRYIGEGNGETVLDIGCHTGIFLSLAGQHGWKTVGVEPSGWAREHARKEFGLDVRAGLEDIGGIKPTVVTLFDIIEHLAEPASMLRTIRERVDAGTRCIITTPDFGSMASRLLRSRWYCIRQQHLFYFTRGSLASLLEHTGWRLRSAHPYARSFTLQYWADRLRRANPGLGTLAATLIRPIQRVHATISIGDELLAVAEAV